MKNLPLALKLFTKTVFCIKISLSGGEVMKIRVEISEDANEEIIICCKEYTDKIGMIEAVLKNTVNEGRELLFYIGNTEYYLPLADILFFEASGGKVYAHTVSHMYTVRKTLTELLQLLPHSFARASKSVIVNVRLIESLRRELVGNGELTFRECDKRVYFSRGYYASLKDTIDEVRFGK